MTLTLRRSLSFWGRSQLRLLGHNNTNNRCIPSILANGRHSNPIWTCGHVTTRTFVKPQSKKHLIRDKNSDSTTSSFNENGNNENRSNDNMTVGARKLFEQIPIHPSILQYIRSIGVGIAPRDTAGRRRRNKKIRFSHHYHENNNNEQQRPPSPPVRKSRPLPQERREEKRKSLSTPTTTTTTTTKTTPDHDTTHESFMPPPPFGPKSLPVRLIGSVGPEAVVVMDTPEPATSSHLSSTTTDTIAVKTTSTGVTTTTNIDMNAFPKNASQIPEIALMGRSNVGKSTLLNALLYGNRDPTNVIRPQHSRRCQVPGQMKLPKGVKAVMSNRPGETRRVSFYKLQHIQTPVTSTTTTTTTTTTTGPNDNLPSSPPQPPVEHRSLLLVDLPGYGFAYAKEKDALAYRTLMYNYLLHRGKTLQRVLLLLDARHGMKKADFDFLTLLEDQHIQNVQNSDSSNNRKKYTLPFPIQIVLTKCDLVTQSDLARRVTQVRQQLSDTIRREPGQCPIMLVSARPGVGFNNVDPRRHVSRGGILELQQELAALAPSRVVVPTNDAKDAPPTRKRRTIKRVSMK